MSLISLFWANASASDIHLLPGLVSPELKRLLRAGDLNAATNDVEMKQLFNMTDLSVTFFAQLAGGLASHGIAMSMTTGEVTVDSDAMKGHSFLIIATAIQGTATATARIRVNIHGAIDKLWLTPKVLTVHKGAKNMRLSVLAQFDDGVIGDITNWSPFEKPGGPADHTYVRPKNSDDRVLAWESEIMSSTSIVKVDPDTGVLDATGESGITKVTVRRQGGKAASASVVCAKPWSTPVKLTHISGPGVKQVNFVPNILFLPDGFQDGDKNEYERLVRFVVTRLSTRNRTRPFQAFTGRINYFMGWVPSPDPGISVLNELYQNKNDKAGEYRGVELPSIARRSPDKWKMEDLINAIGLPTPKGDPINSTPDGDRLNTWQSLYGPDVTKLRVEPLFADWLDRNDRMLLNERDTAFHMAFGNLPAVDEGESDHAIGINPRRLHDDDFNTFLDSLQGPTGRALGNLWTSGKDKGLVVILCRTTRYGASNSFRNVPGKGFGSTIGASLFGTSVHRVKSNSAGDGFDLQPDPIPTDVSYNLWPAIAHELGHSWMLDEEYGGKSQMPTQDVSANTVKSPNAQARTALLLPDGGLSVDNIKWAKWPRIAKAGVLATKPAPVAGGKLTLTLWDEKAAGFKPGDIVRLRTRPLPQAAAPSERCKVESVTGNQMVIVPLFGAAVDPAKFPAESIVMAPVRTKDLNPAKDLYGHELMLADDDVLTRIAVTQNPLNAQPLVGEAKAPNDAPNRPCTNKKLDVPTAATNFPDRKAPRPPAYSSWTIGLYENGGGYNCGIYRPTGTCLMNVHGQPNPKTKDINIYDFCLICRYAIVDTVDPTLHGKVEQDFRERYGKRGAIP